MRVYFHTFGCKANQYDTEFVRQALEAAGATTVVSPEHADAAVVNSCTVTHVGEGKMRGLVRRLQRVKPDINTVVMGCAAAVDEGVIAALPGVTDVIAGANADGVLNALGLSTVVDPILRTFGKGSRAWLKIQDGCDEHCTFCATTIARGAHRSRAADDIVEEALLLAERHHELVITGVHIGSYGNELEGVSLGKLVVRLVRDVPNVRFRLSSLEATEVEDVLIELMASEPHRLAPHLHAPLQSGSDRVLKRMGRHWYTAQTYRERCEQMAGTLRTFGLGADVMVGFPGETDADHAATLQLIRDLPYTYLHVFPYSERPNTAALRLGVAVPPDVVSVRAKELRDLAARRGAEYRLRQHGRVADVVVLDRRRGKYRGLTEDYLDVAVCANQHVAARFQGYLTHGPNRTLRADAADCERQHQDLRREQTLV